MDNVDVNNREAPKKMKCVKFDYKSKVGCAKMCGLCPACAFAPKPAGRTQCLWKVTDGHRRRFVVELLLRCKSTLLLESIQNMLSVTSWTLFIYGRARVPSRPFTDHITNPAFLEEPPDVDMEEIWDWFSSSPDWIKSLYLCRLFLLCDSELLRVFANLTNVLLATLRAVKQRKLSGCNTSVSEQCKDEDLEDPAVMVDPGSSRSMSGVSRYRDFVGCLPVNLSKRILGLLEEASLKSCQKVCRRWQPLVKETMEDKKFRRQFQDQTQATMNKYKGMDLVSPTYANIVEVHVPTHEEEEADIHSSYQRLQPFEAAYAKIKTKFVQMEERNVYCGAHFAKVVLMKEDPHRVLDYRGRAYMATASKDCAAHLYYVSSEAKMVSVMKGHVGTIRAVLLCEDRNLVITASCDASIRCWNLKTDLCEIVLYGHTGTVNCLDVHADRLVSGSKDCTVKVWNLETGKHLQGLNFKHPNSIQCVKINTTKVFSSCARGLVKIWNLEKASVLRVIDAHRSPVRCLFFDEWHLLSGDVNGQVMVWSTNCQVKECLMTFSHPKEVKSLALIYLRVVTGCVDGKIRIFNFLTGDCLRAITVEPKAGCILSLHFLDSSILINTISCVKVYHFAKVFWDYPDSAEESQSVVLTQEESPASLRKVTFNDGTAQETPPSPRIHTSDYKKPEIAELLQHTHVPVTPSKCQTQVRERCKTAPQSVSRSKKVKTCEQTKKRPLRGNTSQNARQGAYDVEANDSTECLDDSNNTDSWASYTPQDSLPSDSQALPTSKQSRASSLQNTCGGQSRKTKSRVQRLERGASPNVSDADVATRRQHRGVFSGKVQPPSADVQKPKGRVGAFTGSAKKQPKPSA
ncbi:CMT1A duplicated region transcript 1 protein [Solea senegalensis]|uniref:CMT1A duplicated region transcript 1 protein n=3 Tax=Solea senegalensis TaxID=28829 RepID=A0AAV6RVP8_SOLSE|nr:CMT1A duplicated region transcript 1 protein [Solea senegalensis]